MHVYCLADSVPFGVPILSDFGWVLVEARSLECSSALVLAGEEDRSARLILVVQAALRVVTLPYFPFRCPLAGSVFSLVH